MKMRKLKIATLFLLVLIAGYPSATHAQNGVSVSPAGVAAHPSAGLDVNYFDKGLLIPRLALTITTLPAPVTAPATSLLVYNTATINDVSPGFYYWDGAAWARLAVDTGGTGGGGGGNFTCSTTFNNGYTVRGDGNGG